MLVPHAPVIDLNIECFDALLKYLRGSGRVGPDETPRFTNLPGGVSNRTVLVERSKGLSFVLKQALERLRVETEWRSDPRRIEREALGLTWLQSLAPAGAITPLLFLDKEHHLLGMHAVPPPHQNWKALLLKGAIDSRHVAAFAELLAGIHRRSQAHEEIPRLFDDRSFFETLRVEPYYRYTAARVPAAADFFHSLIAETFATRLSLVHGDYSPKNVLIHQDRLVLLDHEVIHFGDPAFDIGFSMTHFLSKAHHLNSHRQAIFGASRQYWRIYQESVGTLGSNVAFESRAVRHTLACLLARVEGRSPLEYLSPSARIHQRDAVIRLMSRRHESMRSLIEAFRASLS